MKTLLCLAALVLAGCGAHQLIASHYAWKEWDQARAQADYDLVCQTKAYGLSAQYKMFDCPSRRPLSRDDLVGRVGTARMRAITVMRQKPGALTDDETRRLSEYSAWFGQLR